MNKNRRLFGRAALAAFVFLAVWLLYGTEFISNALFDTSKAVHINPDEIDDSTLIIGTHLIYLHSMTDDIYDVALQSASDSNQNKRYYKSELAGGAWYDITDASSLNDIIGKGGNAVPDEEIRALYMTHHTKKDGITYALSDGRAVNIFNTYDVYDLEKMPELAQLKSRYDIMKETDSSKKEREYVSGFFQTDTYTATTAACDARLSSLQFYYQVLAENDAPVEEKNSVMSVMKKIDNARKIDIYETVDKALSELEKNVTTNDSDDEEDDDEEDKDTRLDDGLLTAIADSESSVSDSRTQAENGLLEEGDGVLSKEEYRTSLELIRHAEEKNHSACDSDNRKLINLDNIRNSVISRKEEELALLDELIMEADAGYSGALHKGETQDYKDMKVKNTAHAALDNRIKQDMSQVNISRSELQFFIQEKTDRMEQEEAQEYILERINGVYGFRKVIPSDDYKDSAADTVDTYEEWLLNLLSQIKQEGQKQGDRGGENLYEQKEELKEQKMEALDDLNLDTAKKINAKLEQVDEKIKELEEAAENEIRALENEKRIAEAELSSRPDDEKLQQKLSGLEAKIAEKTADFPSDSKTKNISDIKTQAKEILRTKDTSQASLDELGGCIDGLKSLSESGSALALDAMKEIYKEMVSSMYLDDQSGYKDLVEKLEEDIADIDIPGILGEELTAKSAVKTVEEALGKDISELTGSGDSSSEDSGSGQEGLTKEEAAGTVIALAEYGEKSGNKEISELAESMAAALSENAKGYVSKTYLSGGELFAPIDTVARFTKYRYLWNSTKKEAVLSQGGTYYRFTAGAKKVILENDAAEEMEQAAGFDGILYLPDSYLKDKFNCSVYDIYGTGYCVLVSQEINELSGNLLEQLTGKGEN